jgi:transcriptional antiterminator RfaH
MNHPVRHDEATAIRWYCARTQPKKEHIAAGSIARRLGLEVFNPRLKLERATRRGVVRVIEPLFPCYIFVRCALSEYSDQIRYVTGVSSLVHFGVRIPAVPDDAVEELRQCFCSGEPMEVEDSLQPGMEVVVSEGAFLGSTGVVVRVFPARQRVQILLDFLGRTTVAEVERRTLIVEDHSLAYAMPGLSSSRQGRVALAA